MLIKLLTPLKSFTSQRGFVLSQKKVMESHVDTRLIPKVQTSSTSAVLLYLPPFKIILMTCLDVGKVGK